MIKDCKKCTFEDLLDYEQPSQYIVSSTEYNDQYETPVLTAGKTFIKGYTNEKHGIFTNLPTIIFDDFTTASQYVNFPFKVKSSAMKILTPKSKLVNLPFTFYALQVHKTRSDTHKRYWISTSSKQEFLLPPLPIQRAIVAKIEQLFSSLDSGIADLKKTEEQLKVYKQAVLKKAFEGELTKEWREQKPTLPSAKQLAKQNKEVREEQYDHKIEEWKNSVKNWKKNGEMGKRPIKPKPLKSFNEPVREIDLNIPDNWFFDTIGNLSTGVEYGSSAKSLDVGDVPVIRMGNMQEGKIVWDDLKYSTSLNEISQYSLKSGDILFNRTNSPELVGKSALYNGERDAIFAGYLIRINHVPSIILSSYLNYFLNSHPAKVYGSFVKTDGVNQSNINGQKLSNYPIPLCSIEEQKEIVVKLDEVFTVCERINSDISEGLKKAEALRQSILKKAFEGRLLSEEEIEKCKKEEDYEPADVLLKKIKNEKRKINT